jgi:uncharacterized protein (UPF0548 family)
VRSSAGFPPGTVLTAERPRGYAALSARSVVGSADRFAELGAAVLSWAVQRRSGIVVVGADGRDAGPVTLGQEVRVEIPVLAVGALALRIATPARVSVVLDEPDAIGFAYGTLRGHPERGEEAFVVRRDGERCLFEVRALSRPAFPYSLAPSAGRVVQRRYTRRYLAALIG